MTLLDPASVPRLQSDRLVLSATRFEELPVILAHWNEPHVRRFLFDGEVVTHERAAGLLQGMIDAAWAGAGCWTIRSSDRFAGLVSLVPTAASAEAEPALRGLLEPVISLTSSCIGRGLASEALSRVLEHAFVTAGQQLLGAAVDEPNERSVRLVERCGFTRLSRVQGPGYPLLTYLLRKDEWAAFR